MYNNFTDENDEFQRMQSKIKDTIESMVTNDHIYNSYNTSCDSNNKNDNSSNIV